MREKTGLESYSGGAIKILVNPGRGMQITIEPNPDQWSDITDLHAALQEYTKKFAKNGVHLDGLEVLKWAIASEFPMLVE